LIQSIAQSAQEQLREACSQVFAQVGESLRRRLLDPPAAPNAKSAAASAT
jgi:hypothetical protein